MVCLALLCPVNRAYGQRVTTIHGNDFGKYNQIFLDDSLWFFHPGDFAAGKQAVITTAGWDTLRNTTFGKTNAPRHWWGMGWFGIWVKADTGLVNRKLFISINHDGASEIFMDGKPMGGYGKVGHSAQQMEAIRAPRELIPLWFADTRPHLLTIRYSNFFGVYPDFLGFQLSIGDFVNRAEKIRTSKQLFDYLPMFAAAQMILGLLHFLFFLFYPRQKLNAYYALFVLLVGINGIEVYQFYLTPYPSVQYLADFTTSACRVLIMWSAVLLLYVLNYRRVPGWRMMALTGITLFYLTEYILKFWVFKVEYGDDYFWIAYFICMADGLWSAAQVIKRGQKDAWLIGIGVSTIILVYVFAWSDMFHIWPYQRNSLRLFVMGAGSLVLPLCLSLYLALDFARTNQNLTVKLQEIANLSARALAQEAEKRELITTEARRLEQIVQLRTAELKEQADKLLELDAVKSRFFTNITHEFKTPLTLIMNPAKELLYTPNGNTYKNLKLIINNAERLLQLINQLLDLSKVESGMMEVNLAAVNLVALVKQHTLSYESLALQKGITLHFTADRDALWILADRDKMDKVVLNILSNALKFTNEGKVEIVLRQNAEAPNSAFTLTVRDTGKGIPATKLPYIFTRFYQVDPSNTRSAEGTGIGLALTKELVELMGGQIWAESSEGLYTQIRIDMPYQATEAIAVQAAETLPDMAFTPAVDAGEVLVADESGPLILLIEDHYELREFIRQSLAGRYRLITAADGEEGITLGLQHIPNLVITDLMMPKVSGYEVSETLKKDEKTSHIPVIILTAKADLDSRVQGIETGADAYLAKPFDQRELLAHIENLINVREQLRLHYSNHDIWLKDTIALPSIEQAFIARIRQAVESHMNEEGYSADQLAADMGLSRTQLHRKLKGLIGHAPGELIRIVRLQYAYDLLERRVATVSEVAYMVGFGSPASFSASFSRHFGFAPSKVVEA
ncbi:signal transduction histidine kinase/DNA-binding response OmpR family regulator [Mucilaginibacter pocheonensis]|uniref:histidine kinase n=1 Tax=Mucilaginibacter pocheonensis TaxID=398050 RepID=A0ABU1TFC2_9SPHI|nr:signal transduction histidine kinase/DNA-binding response OmpR family regulator [Mucilaginibacter pocheonensis]